MTVVERFMGKIDTHNNSEELCWEWLGYKDRYGYGNFKLDGKPVLSHRYMLELVTGEKLKDGEQALHTCDNPSCCNPYHLWKGTNKDNNQDKINKGRHPKGESHCFSKLTEDDIRLIRSLYLGGFTQGYIAGKFGIDQTNVSLIVTKKSWKHI